MALGALLRHVTGLRGTTYCVVWWCMVGLYVVIAVIVVLVAGPKRLVTSIPRLST
jgi:hypothetical protein